MTNAQFLEMLALHALLVAGAVELVKQIWLKLRLANLFANDPERADRVYTAAVYSVAFIVAEVVAFLNYAANNTGDVLGQFGFSVLHPIVGVALYGVLLILPERLVHNVFDWAAALSDLLKIKTVQALNAMDTGDVEE